MSKPAKYRAWAVLVDRTDAKPAKKHVAALARYDYLDVWYFMMTRGYHVLDVEPSDESPSNLPTVGDVP